MGKEIEMVTIPLERYKNLIHTEVRFLNLVGVKAKRNNLRAIWSGMKQRCDNSKNKARMYYLDKNIKVCDEWYDFDVFRHWALKHGYEQGLTIERDNNSKGYNPENCRWISRSEQSKNKTNSVRITIGGKTKILADWCRIYGVHFKSVSERLKKGWDPEKALSVPFQKNTVRFDRIIINTETGIYYKTIREAAYTINFNQIRLKNILCGSSRHNPTAFVYAE